MRAMSRWGLLAVLLSLTVVATGIAQERGKRGPGGRRFGFRGMGMRGARGRDLASLLRIDKVREELDLLDEQIEDLKKLAESGRRPRGERPDFRTMSNEERAKYFEKMRKEFEKRRKEAEAKIKEILLPEQWARLQEIRIQASGIRALLQKDVQAKLKITEEQAKKLQSTSEELSRSMREKMGELFDSGDRDKMREGDRNKIREMITAAQKELRDKLLAVLTDAQREAFEKLKGEPFELPRGAMFGGRRGGFGRGGPGRGGRGGQGRPRPE